MLSGNLHNQGTQLYVGLSLWNYKYFLNSQLITLSLVLPIPSQFSVLLKKCSLQKQNFIMTLKTFIGF